MFPPFVSGADLTIPKICAHYLITLLPPKSRVSAAFSPTCSQCGAFSAQFFRELGRIGRVTQACRVVWHSTRWRSIFSFVSHFVVRMIRGVLGLNWMRSSFVWMCCIDAFQSCTHDRCYANRVGLGWVAWSVGGVGWRCRVYNYTAQQDSPNLGV